MERYLPLIQRVIAEHTACWPCSGQVDLYPATQAYERATIRTRQCHRLSSSHFLTKSMPPICGVVYTSSAGMSLANWPRPLTTVLHCHIIPFRDARPSRWQY